MVTVKALDEVTLADLWQVVPHDEDIVVVPPCSGPVSREAATSERARPR